MKECCWNCCHCDTFAVVCHKDNFIFNKISISDETKKLILEECSCQEFQICKYAQVKKESHSW